jgi:hypothetical protein
MTSLIERHADNIQGVLSCFDRLVITGTIPGICYADGMTTHFYLNKIRIFDYAKWAEPLRNEIRANAERLAAQNNLEIEFIRKVDAFRKEKRIGEILKERGEEPGLVHIFSAMESCSTFRPWHNKKTHKTYLVSDTAKCLHYYFYFILPDLGLCYMRVPTWAPFRLQFYCNGHHRLACTMRKKGMDFRMLDNAFVEIADFDRAQHLAASLGPKSLHRQLDRLATKFCPVIRHFQSRCHWSIMQVEYATDIVFRSQETLKSIYEELVRTAIHSVKPENIATFLGRKLHGNYRGEMGNNFQTRIQGTRIKHHMGKVSIKMYDKHALVLRIETTANDVSFFKHRREVHRRDGSTEMKVAPLQKSIYSLPLLAKLLADANRRYIDFISAIDDPTSAMRDLEKVSRPARDNGRSWRGFNLFHGDDLDLFRVILRGEFNISGFKNKDIRAHMPGRTPSQISRLITRLRKHGLIKKIRNVYKYYLTKLGLRVVLTALKLREMYIIPALRGMLAT